MQTEEQISIITGNKTGKEMFDRYVDVRLNRSEIKEDIDVYNKVISTKVFPHNEPYVFDLMKAVLIGLKREEKLEYLRVNQCYDTYSCLFTTYPAWDGGPNPGWQDNEEYKETFLDCEVERIYDITKEAINCRSLRLHANFTIEMKNIEGLKPEYKEKLQSAIKQAWEDKMGVEFIKTMEIDAKEFQERIELVRNKSHDSSSKGFER